jgi:hypothetical protein
MTRKRRRRDDVDSPGGASEGNPPPVKTRAEREDAKERETERKESREARLRRAPAETLDTAAIACCAGAYVSFSGASVQRAAREMTARVPAAAARQLAEARGDTLWHMTLVGPREVRLLPNELKRHLPALVQGLRRRLRRATAPEFVGVGSAADAAGNRCWFAVARWEVLQEARAELGLPRKDLHVTLGFCGKDVHRVGGALVDKGVASLLPEEAI